MEITDVRVRPLTGDGKVKALCSIILDGAFAVHDLRVVQGANGLFVSMPARRTNGGEYRDVAHPITGEMRDAIQKQVLAAYQQGVPERTGA